MFKHRQDLNFGGYDDDDDDDDFTMVIEVVLK